MKHTEKTMTISNHITNEEFCQLSPQDRCFYLENKDKMEMAVINRKLHFVVRNNQPYVTWERFKELLKLADSFNEEEAKIMHVYTDFNKWNVHSMPYRDYGFYYHIDFSAHSYALDELGIKTPVKEWLVNWLTEHGFLPEETATVKYTGGFSSYISGEVTKSDTYEIEMRVRFTDVPPHYIPEKVHKWLKKNPQWKHKVYSQEILNEQN